MPDIEQLCPERCAASLARCSLLQLSRVVLQFGSWVWDGIDTNQKRGRP